ncbi:MAG: ATP-dependent zinc metalloprotease FtsH [Pseudomonadota bacterium]
MFVVVGILLLQRFSADVQRMETIAYSDFQAYLEQGRIAEVLVTENYIRGVFKTPIQGGSQGFVTMRLDPAFAGDLTKYGVKVTGGTESSFLRDLFSWLAPMLLLLVIWMFLLRRLADKQGLGGGLMSVGKSRAKMYVETDTKVTFDDVAGVDEAKEELHEIVDFLKNPQEYGRLGGRVPKGVLLVGPPGTGKTLLARAIAGEAGVTFFSISGSEFVEMFVGVGAASVRDLFEQARRQVPCIIFIDELDALGRARGIFPVGGGHDEKEQTLNQLLHELDGFDPREGLILLGATNRPEILDPALMRAGRFDRQILVDRPDKKGREDILGVHLRKARLAEDVVPEKIAALTPGFTGADLANLVNEATLLATRRRAESVTMEDFTRAVERIVAGLEKKNRLLNPFERKTVAYHESGHTLVALSLPGSDKVHKVSIIPRGIGSLGYTIQRPTEDRYLMTQEELENKMCILLGGRAAEHIIFDKFSTGAVDDIAKATDIARSMVTQYGMVESLGQVAYDKVPAHYLDIQQLQLPQERRYSEDTARKIDCAVREIIQAAFERATAIVTTNRDVLEKMAGALLEQETLEEEALTALTANLAKSL